MKGERLRLSKDKIAREYEMSFEGANLDAFLDPEWVEACVDAHRAFGMDAEGTRIAGFDPADTGHANGLALRRGQVCVRVEKVRNGADREIDISGAFPWAVAIAEEERCQAMIYDADGLGGVAMKLHKASGMLPKTMEYVPFRGVAAPLRPDEPFDQDDPRSKKNKDAFFNRRAQAWETVRRKMQLTFQARKRLEAGRTVGLVRDVDIISIDGGTPHLRELMTELSSPKRVRKDNGKVQVEGKEAMKGRGVMSPNLADAFVYAFSEEPWGEDFWGDGEPLAVRLPPRYDPAAGY